LALEQTFAAVGERRVLLAVTGDLQPGVRGLDELLGGRERAPRRLCRLRRPIVVAAEVAGDREDRGWHPTRLELWHGGLDDAAKAVVEGDRDRALGQCVVA